MTTPIEPIGPVHYCGACIAGRPDDCAGWSAGYCVRRPTLAFTRADAESIEDPALRELLLEGLAE